MNNTLTTEQANLLRDALSTRLIHLKFLVSNAEGCIVDEMRAHRARVARTKTREPFAMSANLTERIANAKADLQAFVDAMRAAGISVE